MNHRRSLSDGILIKDNHLALLQGSRRPVEQACRLAHARRSTALPIIVEVESLSEVRQALAGKPDVILLDNMAPNMVRRAVALIKQAGSGGSVGRHHTQERPSHGSSRRGSHLHRSTHPFCPGGNDQPGHDVGSAFTTPTFVIDGRPPPHSASTVFAAPWRPSHLVTPCISTTNSPRPIRRQLHWLEQARGTAPS